MTSASIAVVGILFLATSSPAAPVKKPEALTVYVFATPSANGFVDSDTKARQDTAKDLIGALKSRGIHVVEKRESASVVLEVIDRHIEVSGPNGAAAVPVGNMVVVAPLRQQLRLIAAAMHVRDDTPTTFRASGGGSWGKLADLMAKDVGTWLRDNDAKIASRRRRAR